MEERLQFLFFWIKENRQRILWGFSTFFICLAIFFWKQRGVLSSSNSKHYLESKQLSSGWEQNPVSNIESYQALKKAVASSLVLKEKMGTDLLTYSLMHQESDQAQNVLQDILRRIGTGASYHLSFTKTSMLMSRHEWENALNEAHNLHESLTKQTTHSSSIESIGKQLMAYNLFRIAFLQKQLSFYEQEQNTLSTLEALLKEIPNEWGQSPRNQVFSLLDYVSFRQQQLKQIVKASS